MVVIEGLGLYNITKEVVRVDISRIHPAKHTLNQPSYPYLHLKFKDKNGCFIELSNGKQLAIFHDYFDILCSWNLSDVLLYKPAGLFSVARLFNQTRGESIPVNILPF